MAVDALTGDGGGNRARRSTIICAVQLLPPHLKIPRFLGPELVAQLLALAETRRDQGQPARVGYGASARLSPSHRVSEHLGDLGPLSEPLEARVREHAAEWRSALGIAPFAITQLEVELVRHGDGAFFARHIDTASAGRRVMSVVYYFHLEPKPFAGGLLRLFAPDATSVDVEPECDLAVVFPSFMVHEVTPVSCPSGRFMDSRFAVNCWLLRDQPVSQASPPRR